MLNKIVLSLLIDIPLRTGDFVSRFVTVTPSIIAENNVTGLAYESRIDLIGSPIGRIGRSISL